MLIINGTPIKNYLDLYEHFDVSEIIGQLDAFIIFAKNHLNFNAVNAYCIEVLECVAADGKENGKKLFKCISEQSFWQGRLDNLLPVKIRKPLTDEEKNRLNAYEKKLNQIEENIIQKKKAVQDIVCTAYIDYKHYGKQTQDAEWEKKFVIAAASTILAGRNFEIKAKKSKGEENQYLVFDETDIKLKPGKEYACKYDPERALTNGEVLKTVALIADSGYSSSVTICFGETCCTYDSGDKVYVNVVGDTVVRILPNEVQCSGGVLKREMRRNCITFNGEKTDIPADASSFAAIAKGKYIYIKDNRANFLGIDPDHISEKFYSPKVRFVEAVVRENSYYLLTPNGIVKNWSNETPADKQKHYISLEKAL